MSDTRDKYLESKRGDLTRYAGMIGEEFASKVNRLSQIIGTSHELSVGEYKELILRGCLEQYIPKRYSIGTGFVVFISESSRTRAKTTNTDILNLKEHRVSSQLDIIVYDDTDYVPIFRGKDFVIVSPEFVRAIIEVKGFLKCDDVGATVKKYIEFGQSWHAYQAYKARGRIEGSAPVNDLALLLMAWDVYVDFTGAPACDGARLRRTIVKTYRERLSAEELDPRAFPLLSAAFIYNDCAVNLSGYDKDGEMRVGYFTGRGRFVRYDEQNKPHLDRDFTISELLARIYVNLDVPFNPDFAYFDQSFTLSVHPHPFGCRPGGGGN